MLKKSGLFICFLILAFLITSVTVYAQQPIRVLLDDRQLNFDVPPTTIDGRTMVPMRVIFEELGAEIEWNASSQSITATRDDINIVLMLNATRMYINSIPFRIDAPATEINGRTFVPLRVIADAFGADVEWDGIARTASIYSPTVDIMPSSIAVGYGIQLASEMFTNTHVNTGNQRIDMVEIARTQIGYCGIAARQNRVATKYTRFVTNNHGFLEWCAHFVVWVARQAGVNDQIIRTTGGAGPVSLGVDFHPRDTYTPQPGDLVFFNWNRTSNVLADHVSIIENVANGRIYVISGNFRNGVTRHNYLLTNMQIIGFGVPRYINSEGSTVQTPSEEIRNFTSIQPAQQRFTTRDGAPVRERPYNNGRVLRTIARTGEVVNVNGHDTNTRNNRWYSVVGGGWIYGGNITQTNPNPSPPPVNHTVTVRENNNRTTGITSETIFNFRANTNFDATRVVITFSGGGQFNMNRTNSRNWYFNTRLTVPGEQTITVHAYEGNVRRASHSMTVTTQPAQAPPVNNNNNQVQPPPVNHSVTVRSDNGVTGTTSDTVFQLRANTNFDATRVVITFSGGGQFNMNRTNSRNWYFNTRLTVPGTQTITVHAYEGSVRRASHSMTATTQPREAAPPTSVAATRVNPVTVNGSSATVSWSNVPDATRYDVYLVQDPWGWNDIRRSASVAAGVTSHTFTNLPAGYYNAFVIARPNTDHVQSNWSSFSVIQASVNHSITVRENNNRTEGIVSETVFNFRANPNFDATRVVIEICGGTRFNMNRTNARNWYLNTRLTSTGTRTITVHAYEGNVRRASDTMTVTVRPAQQVDNHSVTVSSNNGITGTTSETVFQLRANTNFDATRVVITFSGGGQFNMNRTNSRNWYLNTRLTVPGTQTITVHAYEGNTRRASHSMTATTSPR